MRAYLRMGLLAAALVMTACDNSKPAATSLQSPETTLGQINVSPVAAVVAVGGTQQLSITGQTLTGAPITAFDSVKYVFSTLSDSLRVSLNATTGLVTGLTPSSGPTHARINVFAFKGDAVRGDVALVQVTQTAVANPSILSIQPGPADSARLASGTAKTVTPRIRNAVGDSVVGAVVRYLVKPEDALRVGVFIGSLGLARVPLNVPTGATVTPTRSPSNTPNQFTPWVGQGTAWIFAKVTAYGTPLQDSVLYTFTYPYTITIAVVKTSFEVTSLGYAGGITTLAPGATVTFQNGVAATDPLTIAFSFDNPGAAIAATPASTTGGASGNVTTLTGTQTSKRRFLTAGTYQWTAVAAGGPAPWPGQSLTGTIVIK